MTQPDPINPRMTDIFRTALDAAENEKAAQPPSLPSIVFNGSNNVVSWGGTVYMTSTPPDKTRTSR
jgi:hypothetical protein